MAVPVVETTTVQQFASSHPWSVTKPSSVAAGNLLLVLLASATATWSTPSGWTAGPSVVTNGRQVSSFWRIADGSEGASFSFDAGANLVGCSVCLRISGTHQTSPINGNASGSTGAGGANPTTVGSITTTASDCLLVTGWSFTSSVGRNFTGPAGTTKVADQNSSSPQEEVWSESIAAAGSTGTRDWTLSTTTPDRTALALAIRPPSTATSVNVGQATETDTAQPVAKLKTRAAAQSAETDSAQAVAKLKTRATGQASETDTAQPVARLKTRSSAQATETDIAQAITPAKTATAGQAADAEAAMPITPVKARELVQAEEIGDAQILAALKATLVGQAEEIDTARPIFAPGIVKPAIETDTAQQITPSKLGLLTLVVEAEVAMPITAVSASRGDGYTDAVVGVITAPDAAVGIITAPTGRY